MEAMRKIEEEGAMKKRKRQKQRDEMRQKYKIK